MSLFGLKVLILFLFCIIPFKTISGEEVGKTEQPDYTLIASKDNFDVRDYPPMIVAEVEVSGDRKQAINEGFKILADYIFGNNTSTRKIEKTTPVYGELSEKIAMTAPVLQERHMNQWKVRFIMPKKYTLDTLPQPNSPAVRLITYPSRRLAVIRFSGTPGDNVIVKNTQKLKEYMSAERMKPIGDAIFAFYNPPWTLPFLRRNEIMFEIVTVD